MLPQSLQGVVLIFWESRTDNPLVLRDLSRSTAPFFKGEYSGRTLREKFDSTAGVSMPAWTQIASLPFVSPTRASQGGWPHLFASF